MKTARTEHINKICILMTIAIVAGLYFPALNAIALLIFAIGVMQSKHEDILCVTVFLMSFTPIFKINLGGFALFNLAVIIAIVRLMIIGRIDKRKVMPLFILIIYSFAFGIRNGYSEPISIVVYLLFGLLIFEPDKISFTRVIHHLSLGIIITSVLAMLKGNLPGISQVVSQAHIRYSAGVYYDRFSGLEGNPNYYTMILSIAVASFSVIIINGKARVIDYIYIILMLFFGLMSVSQSFVVTLVINAGLFLLLSQKRGKAKNIIAFLFIGFGVAILLNEQIMEILLFRYRGGIESDSLDTLTTGRSSLWSSYINYIISNLNVLLFGRGIGAKNLPVGASHSFYIDLLYHLGLVGTIIYIICIKRIFSAKQYLSEKAPLYLYIPWIIFFVRALARNLLVSEQLVIMFVICSLSVCYEYWEDNSSYALSDYQE